MMIISLTNLWPFDLYMKPHLMILDHAIEIANDPWTRLRWKSYEPYSLDVAGAEMLSCKWAVSIGNCCFLDIQ